MCGRQKREILNTVSGYCPRKELLAIIGPSGAGKTTLLNILAARKGTRNMTQGHIGLQGSKELRSQSRKGSVCYVTQHDGLMDTQALELPPL